MLPPTLLQRVPRRHQWWLAVPAHILAWAWLVVLCALVLGCDDAQPAFELHPVNGIVVGNKGDPIISGGVIEFRSTNDPLIRSIGSLDTSGRFELSTRTEDAKHLGARPGVYQVTVFPTAAKFVEPIVIPGTTTVASGQNELTITIDASKL